MRLAFLKNFAAIMVIIGLFAGGYVLGQSEIAPIQVFGPESKTPAEAQQAFGPFWETWHFLQDEFYAQPLDNVALAEGAIEGMLATLDDPNTRYLSPEQEQAERQRMEGNLEGIGAEVTVEDGAITIVAPYEGSPAEEAGIQVGDILREADGVELTGMSAAEAATLVRGPAGTVVRLLIERNGELLEIEVTRGVIRVPSVRGEILEENLAYVRLSRFGNNTTEELQEILDELIAEDPAGLILDLRHNPGGSLPTAVDVADEFLTTGPILLESFGNGDETLFEATDDGRAQDLPLVVLIDGGSASGSEVLAGAIRDRERGTLIGETSFGKGTVQRWRVLSNGGGVRITVARWLTPDGEWVHGEGLDPEVAVDLAADDSGELEDAQLQAAINFLLEQPMLQSPEEGEG